jgi:hypothetical protein
MNYFSHAIRFLDRPVFAVSTGLPDMLSVADRKVRLRSRRMEPFRETASPFDAEVAAGALQHLEDDAWFHKTRAFLETSAELTRLFRETIGVGDGMRCSFLGHIVTELQLDGVLAERYPALLDQYYELMGEADAVAIQDCVNRMAAKQTERLAILIPKFHQEQFLRDYAEPARLRFRWRIVESRAEALLPPEHFEFPDR